MPLTNQQDNEIIYYKSQISNKKEALSGLEADTENLLNKIDKRSGVGTREYLIHGEKISKLQKEIEEFEAKIAAIISQ